MLWKEEVNPPLEEDLEKPIVYIRHKMKAERIH
jgi:hypothetical protein